MAELADDSEYQSKLAAQRDRADAVRATEALIMRDVEAVGHSATSLADLRRRLLPLPPEVVQVLAGWLQRTSDATVQEEIVRSLASVEESFDVSPLLTLFERAESESLRWAIANTVAELRPLDARSWVIESLGRRDLGRAREMLPLALARIAPPNVANHVLVEYLAEMPGHVALALAESGGAAERQQLEDQLPTAKKWEKREIQRAIKAIQRRLKA